MQRYGLDIWGDNNFIINDDGEVCINHPTKPAIINMVKQIRKKNLKGPLLLRFPHLAKKQLEKIYVSFQRAIDEFEYRGNFNAVFPLKVNQYPEFVTHLMRLGNEYNYGLEAGSKAELLLAMAYTPLGSTITVNGFKDKELIAMGFLASLMGHNITITIEGLSELKNIINISRMYPTMPNIGIRVRLHSAGKGVWAKSGGITSKFGLTSTEIIKAVNMLKKANLLDSLTMIHFHIGSQITEINPLKKALREVGNVYAELRKMGASNLKAINLGGGLAIEYSQSKNSLYRNYSLSEYSNDVVFLLKEIAKQKEVNEPDIFIESGRYISASHALLVAPVLELFSSEYTPKRLTLKEKNPPLITELNDLYNSLNAKNALEYLHDSIDHMESLLTLFDLGYIDLQDRANTEILANLIIKKAIILLSNGRFSELLATQKQVQEKYLVNFSLFQSMPDFWGISQNFPIMPLNHLNEEPTRSASIWDITCDSDGEIEFNPENPLFLHDVNPQKEDYFLGFFLVGAYQEVLGMKHNLFSHPTEATVVFDANGYKITNILESQSIKDIFDDLDYDSKFIQKTLMEKITNSTHIDEHMKKEAHSKITAYLNGSGYLKTTYSRGKNNEKR